MPARSIPSASALVLRALPTLDALPAGSVTHLVADASAAPHLLPGEFAVIDTTDREPIHGELYVIRYSSPLTDSGFRDRVIEACRRPYRSPEEADGWRWWACPYVRPLSGAELEAWADAGRPFVLSEGPFKPGAMEAKLVGRVIGVLAATFEEPDRGAAAEGGAA